MLPVFQKSASPEEAFKMFASFCASYQNVTGQKFGVTPKNENLLHIFGNSKFLSLKLGKMPEIADHYANSNFQTEQKPRKIFQQEIDTIAKSHDDLATLVEALKHYKYQEYLRLTIRELKLLSQPEIYEEFSFLAYEISRVVCDRIFRDLLNRYDLAPKDVGDYAIIAMGKLGGMELNYSSDIDLIGLYEKEAHHEKISNHEFFTKLFVNFGKALSDRDEHGFLFRVDWDLRPEGKAGTLANSLPAIETYYETFGEEWERQAFIKAAVLHQQKNVGDEFLKMIAPFVYRKSFDIKTIENVRDIKLRILEEINKQNIDGIDIKRGTGGIRDIEFLIQGHQLLYGGKHPKARGTSTLKALENLDALNTFPKGEAKELREAYLFLRRMESALQMENEQQTHVLPQSHEARFKVAKRMGYEVTQVDEVNLMNQHLGRHQERVKELFDEFYQRQ